ncbi:hypothetical protein K504DRAFT_356166, partial [Pleomassaria siparia CBS 279.74]
IALLLTPISIIGTTWLYLYPLFHGCGFPVPPPNNLSSPSPQPRIAPFRLLALGDPQLEGDSSLPKPGTPIFPAFRFLEEDLRNAQTWSKRKEILGHALKRAVTKDAPKWLGGKRKMLDLWGNDYYLAHIVRSLRWWTEPSHVAVVGDLLGSQWISDGEFETRAERYWGRVFKGMEKVPDRVMEGEAQSVDGEKKTWGKTVEILGADKGWENRVINIAGNHDVGYAGDMSPNRIERFERAFGKAHWDIVFTLPIPPPPPPPHELDSPGSDEPIDSSPPALRIVIFNSMNLDTPALSHSLQMETYDFVNHIISTSRPVTDKTHATILLTHIPLHKESGICVDSPFFSFHPSGSGVKEQNMLSEYASKMLLEGMFGLSGNQEAEGQGLGRRGIILNGHDHEGCDVVHYISRPKQEEEEEEEEEEGGQIEQPDSITGVLKEAQNQMADSLSTPEIDGDMAANGTTLSTDADFDSDPPPTHWLATHTPTTIPHTTPQIREITLRSMMGDFSGYAGFLSAWYDPVLGEWKLEFETCGVGVQHWWWGVHVVNVVLLAALGVG